MDLYQQPHRYMRPLPPPPPPPSTADPYHNQQLGPRPPGPPPQGPWFSNQFQYHHPAHSPSPPPPPAPLPPPSPWGPPPPPPPLASAGSFPPPPHPYSAQHIQHNQFPPLSPQTTPHHRPHMVPHLSPHSQIPQPYSQVNQDWGNQNRAPPPQNWDYSGQNNEEDWATRARAWADAKAAMENQHSQCHYALEQYQQANSSHYLDAAHQCLSPSSYEQFPVAATLNQLPGSHQQESASLGTEPSSFVPDGFQHYPVRDGALGKDMNAVFHHQGNLPSSSSVNQQEVPSSYSSVTGKEEMADQNEQSYRLFPARNSSSQEGQPHLQPSFPPPYVYGNQSVDPIPNPADQPLDFAPRFGHDHDLQMHSNYAHHDSVGPGGGMDSINTWTPPVVPGMGYPPMPSGFPSAPQPDPSIALPSSVSGHNAPPFGSFPGRGLPSAIPSGATPFPLTAGTTLPTTAYPGDTYGISNMSERPKKAPVPNWLREEIKKAVITGSPVDHPKEETQFIEDEGLDNSFMNGDQADSKSIDSSRSTEEEDDEDDVEAAKTAAINLEIKRVLTEVLLKVTDELFDEIATKVLDEDDSTAPANRNTVTSNQKEATFTLPAPTPKASAKVLIPFKPKEQEPDTDGGDKSSSNSTGNVLGLANYDSDEDEDKGNGEIQSLNMSDSSKNYHLQHSNTIKLVENMHVTVGNGSSQIDQQEHSDLPTNIKNNSFKTSLTEFRNTNSTAISKVNGDLVDEEKEQVHTSKSDANGKDNEIKVSGSISRSKEASSSTEFKAPKENFNEKESPKSHRGKETKMKVNKDDRHESRTSSSGKDNLKEVKETAKTKKDEIGDENRQRQDERHLRKEKNSDCQKLTKERKKDDEIKHGERAKESGSKKRSTHSETRDDHKETNRSQRSSAKDITDKRREQTKGNEEERSLRQKSLGDSSRHKSKRSPSNSRRGRSSKENSASHANSSSDSDDSRRKPRSRKRNSSPSPVRSKRRQVSRSPHSKHSQRRHSPYSSLDSTRGRRLRLRSRSRSKSPVRRKR